LAARQRERRRPAPLCGGHLGSGGGERARRPRRLRLVGGAVSAGAGAGPASSMLERVRAALPALPPAEQRVANLVIEDARSFAMLPVGELADRARVSKPTVVRFCRSVGYGGLADFKRRLAGSVNEGVPFVHRAVDEQDRPAELIVKVIDNAVAALLR